MGLKSQLAEKFKSNHKPVPEDFYREQDLWMRDISAMLAVSGRSCFTQEEFDALKPINRAASAASKANDLAGVRDAYRRYRDAARQILGITVKPSETGFKLD